MSSAIVPNSAKVYSGFTPRNIPFCSLWLDAADISTLTLSGSSVTTWADKSGNGRTGTRAGTVTYTQNAINNLGAVTFSGVSGSYIRGSLTNTGNTCTAFAVGTMASTATGNSRILSLGAVGAVDWNNAAYAAAICRSGTLLGFYNFRANNGTSVLSFSAFNVPFLTGCVFDGTNKSIAMNGTLSSNASTGNFNISSYTVGSSFLEEGSLNYGGYVGELIVYNAALTVVQRQQVEGYLVQKWGLKTPLIATHPFKRSPLYTRIFQPTDIDGCRLWLDGLDPNGTSTLPSNGAAVTAWIDKSASGNSAISSGTAPTFSTNSIAFNGTGFYNTNYSAIFTNQSFFIVVRFTSLSADFNLITGTQSNQLIFYVSPSLNRWPYVGSIAAWGRFATTPLVTNTRYLTNFTWSSPATIALYINGTAPTLSVAGGIAAFSGTPTTSQIGPGLVGNIFEIIGYNVTLTETQRQQVEGYLADKWGLRSSFPSTHFFKTFPPLTVGFNPIQVSGCALWLDASDTSTVGRSGSNVTSWSDKSGNNRNATPYQSPTITTINGLQAITLGGTRNFDGAITNGTANLTVFAVAVSSGGSPDYNRLVSLATFNSTVDAFTNGFVVALEHPNDMTALGAERNTGTIYTTGSGTITTNVPFLASSTWTATTVSMFINGTNRVSSTYASRGNFTYANYAIGRVIQSGASGTNPSFVWPGSVCEIIIYHVSLTTEQRQRIEGYLAWKWRLNNSLPATHPFFKTQP